MLRRLLLVVVCFLPLTLTQASANSSAPGQPGQIVYASTRGPNVNNAEIYSIGVDGSQRRDLTCDQGNDGSFAWSPTGDRVAFWAARAGVRAQGLFVMRADGSAQQRLTPPDLSVSPYGDPPTWSPDGRRIAFSAYRDGYGIWVVGADGSGLTRLTDAGHFPVWAPQGSRIAFVSGETDYDYALEVVDADGGGRLRLAEGNVLSPPTWSPDAGALAYVWRDRYVGHPILYRVDASGGTPQALFSNGDHELATPDWSPSGSPIVFTDTQTREITTVDADGGAGKALAIGMRPAWSPDGMRIAYATDVGDSGVYVMAADGTEKRRVRDERAAIIKAGPAWSPDGTTLLFASVLYGGDFEIYVADEDGSRPRQLTSNNVADVLPAWSPDHARIAYAHGSLNDRAVWVMRADGSHKHRLRLGTHPSWSPQGTRLAFQRYGFVYTMTARARRVRRIAVGRAPTWAPRGTRIAFLRGGFVRDDGSDSRLLVVDAQTRAVRSLARFYCPSYGEGGPPNAELASPEWSPDGAQLVVPVTCDYERFVEVHAVLVVVRGPRSGEQSELPIEAAPYRVAWSPAGNRIAFVTRSDIYVDAPRIVTTGLDGSDSRTVSSGAGFDRDPDW